MNDFFFSIELPISTQAGGRHVMEELLKSEVVGTPEWLFQRTAQPNH
jgi:hypothetical protein